MTKSVLMPLGVGLLLAAMLTPTPADAAVIVCKKGKKLLLREDACKGSKETQVELSGAGIDVSSLPAVPTATSAASAETATSADSATSAETCETATDADLLDGLEAADLLPRWATVNSDCSEIIAQSGGISIVAITPVTGICVLDFGSDLRGHGIAATVRGGLSVASKGWAQAGICGAPDGGAETSNCNVEGAANTPNELAIARVDPDGNGADRSFYVAVLPAIVPIGE